MINELFFVSTRFRAKCSGLKLHQGRFRCDVKTKFLIVRKVGCWNRFLGGCKKCPGTENIPNTSVLRNRNRWHCTGRRGTKWCPEALCTTIFYAFYVIKIHLWNQRVIYVVRDLWRSSGPIHLLKQYRFMSQLPCTVRLVKSLRTLSFYYCLNRKVSILVCRVFSIISTLSLPAFILNS